MSRLARLAELRSHPMIGKDFARLSQAQLDEVVVFIANREHLTDDEFMHEANRFKLDDPDRSRKAYSIQWSLITSVVDTVGNLQSRRTSNKGDL